MNKSNFQNIALPLGATFEDIVMQSKTGETMSGLNTGYVNFNAVTNGLRKNDLVLLAGLEAEYFSGLAMNMALRIAKGTSRYPGCSIAMFSLEATEDHLCKKMLAARGRISLVHLHGNQLTQDDWDNLIAAADAIVSLNIFIDSTPGLSLDALWQAATALAANNSIKLIVIDNAELLTWEKNTTSDEKRMEHRIAVLKMLSNSLGIPIVVGLPVPYGPCETRAGFLNHEDFADYVTLERYCDILIFLREKEMQKQQGNVKKISLNIVKNRHGLASELELMYLPDYCAFEEDFIQP